MAYRLQQAIKRTFELHFLTGLKPDFDGIETKVPQRDSKMQSCKLAIISNIRMPDYKKELAVSLLPGTLD